MMQLISLCRGLVHRAGSAALILVVVVVVVVVAALAAAGPVYYQAVQQSILAGTLSSAPFIGLAYEVTPSASICGTLPLPGRSRPCSAQPQVCGVRADLLTETLA